MNKRRRRTCGAVIAVALLAAGLASNTSAQTARTKIRLGTLVPSGSSYYHSLESMGAKWRQASNGTISLTIYGGGTMGSEDDIVKRMRVGQLQAAVITAAGLSEIDPSVSALQKMPLMFRSLEEAVYVQEKLAPDLARRLEAKGFVVLFWGNAGWVRLFSKEPGFLPEDFRKMRIFVTANDIPLADLYRSAGFHPVLLEWADVLTSSQTGMVDAVPTIPFHVLTNQFYLSTHHMLELNWLPLVGALIITKRSWDALQPAEREAMLKSAAECGQELQVNGRKENQESVETMQKRGQLTVHPVSKEAEETWRHFSESLYPQIRGNIVPAEMFDKVVALLVDYRATHGASGR